MTARRTGALLFAAAAALSAFTILREIGPHDEGLMLQATARIADGQLPYRDFWWNYGPGQPYLLGALWKLFGPSLMTWRIVRVALDATVALLVYLLVRREATQPTALLAYAAAAGAMAWPSGPGPNPAALALVLGALLTAPSHPRRAGVICGLAIAFRPEIGVAGAISTALLGKDWRPAALAIAIGALAYLPFLIAAPGDLLSDTVGFLGVQHRQRLPLPTDYDGGFDPNKILEYFFSWVLLAGAAIAIVASKRALYLLPLLAVGVLYLVGRPDEFHLVPLSVVLAIALAAAAHGPARIAALVALALIAFHGLERRAGQALHPPDLASVPSPVADGVKTTTEDADALKKLLPRLNAPIFVAPPRFDKVRVGNPLLYVLAGRPNPTRYDVIQPGVVTTAKNQREMVDDLEKARPPLLVRWVDERASATEPNGSSRSSGVHLLDRYLARTYGQPERFGAYVLLKRR
jgi:hypothetical protein